MLQQTPEMEKANAETEECRTQYVNAEFSTCLTEEKRYRCNHAFLFGDGYLCTHPDHGSFRS